MIEEIYSQWGERYKGFQNLNEIKKNFKDIDFDGELSNLNEVVSLKTYQPKSATEKTLSGITKKIQGYAEKLSDAKLKGDYAKKNRVLDFVIQKGEWDDLMPKIEAALEEIRKNNKDITIKISQF